MTSKISGFGGVQAASFSPNALCEGSVDEAEPAVIQDKETK